MRIVYDGRWIGRTGIGRYAGELLNELQRLDHTNDYLVLLLPEQFKTWRPAAPNFHAVRTTHEVYTWQEQLLLPRQISRLHPDLVHFTSFNLPVLYRGRFITTIHDLILIHFKNNHGSLLHKLAYEFKYWIMRAILRVVTRRAAHLIVPCEFTKQDLQSRYHLPASHLTVTYEAVGNVYNHPEPFADLPENFIMYLGNMYPYKNLGRLIEAFANTKARATGTKLILAGRTPYFEDQLKTQARNLGVTADVIFTGRVTDGQAATLYRHTQLFVFPSLYEGFGLMGLEAMTLGAPVLAARASCLPEIYGAAADYCNPLDPADITRHIDALLADPQRRHQLIQAGRQQVKRYSWTTLAQQTLEVYQAVKIHS